MLNATSLSALVNVSWPVAGNNGSDVSFPPWGFVTIFGLVITILSLIFNGATLFVFVEDKRLRSQTFSVYPIILLSNNLVYAVMENPLNIRYFLYPTEKIGMSSTTSCPVINLNKRYRSCCFHDATLGEYLSTGLSSTYRNWLTSNDSYLYITKAFSDQGVHYSSGCCARTAIIISTIYKGLIAVYPSEGKN